MRSIVQTDLERKVAAIVNEQRRKARLPAMTQDPLLAVAARAHSADMGARGYFSHHSPEGSTVADRVALTGYLFAIVGENIAIGQKTPREVMAAWMLSRGHKANILHPGYTQIGVGVAPGKGGILVWTQNFGTPAG